MGFTALIYLIRLDFRRSEGPDKAFSTKTATCTFGKSTCFCRAAFQTRYDVPSDINPIT